MVPQNSSNFYSIYAVGQTIYAGGNAGLFISFNGGDTWTNALETNVRSVYVLGNNIYVAASDNGLYISTDNGQNFSNYTTDNGLGSLGTYGVYAVGDMVYVGTDNGLSISTNDGQSFTNYTTADGLGNNFVLGVYASNNTVYAGTYGGGLSIATFGTSPGGQAGSAGLSGTR